MNVAYIGPGSGLSAIGALLALVIGLLVAFAAFVWYPLRRFRRKLRERARASALGSENGTAQS